MSTTLSPEQLFSDPAEVLDWLNSLDPDGGAGVASRSDDCTLSRYARAKLGIGSKVRVGARHYLVAQGEMFGGLFYEWGGSQGYSAPRWVARFIEQHDQAASIGEMVSVAQAKLILKRVIRELAAEAQAAEAQRAYQLPLWSLQGNPFSMSLTNELTPGSLPTLTFWNWSTQQTKATVSV